MGVYWGGVFGVRFLPFLCIYVINAKILCTIKRPISKRPNSGFHHRLLLNAGQKYCRMLPLEHSAILSTFIKLPSVIKTFVLSISEWPFYTFYCSDFKIPFYYLLCNEIQKNID